MSNYEYDALYDELAQLEKELHVTLAGSPTIHVGYEVVSELPKERHESPMLSLDKTKDVEDLRHLPESMMWSCPGRWTGSPSSSPTRTGSWRRLSPGGTVKWGKSITGNARVFKNIPLRIPYEGELILRGEAVIGYRDFERINQEIPDADARYKNPRNLCSGSVRQRSSEITAKRNVQFYAFSLVRAEGVDFGNSRARQLDWLKGQGFDVVEHYVVAPADIEAEVIKFSEKIAQNDFPSDGLVLIYDDIRYGESLGRTAKFPRDSLCIQVGGRDPGDHPAAD